MVSMQAHAHVAVVNFQSEGITKRPAREGENSNLQIKCVHTTAEPVDTEQSRSVLHARPCLQFILTMAP